MNADSGKPERVFIKSFEPVKIKFERSREVSQFNQFTGESVDRDKATETWIILDAVLEFRGFRQRFEVLGKIEQRGFDKDKLWRKVKAAVSTGLRSRVVWDFYALPEVPVKADDPELDADEAEGELDDIIATRLEEQAKNNDEAMKEWKAAIDEMTRYLSDGPKYHIRELREAFGFVESCTQVSRQGQMYGWHQEKLARVRRALDDIARRIDTNHAGFRASVEDIRVIYSWPVTNAFQRQPPRRQKAVR